MIEIAIQLEKAALSDSYFTSRKLYPNVDFYTGTIYKALGRPHFLKAKKKNSPSKIIRKSYSPIPLKYITSGFPTDMFPVLFAVPRTVGWLAHWFESIQDPEVKIVRPRQLYEGPSRRDFTPVSERRPASYPTREISMSAYHKRAARDVKVRIF